MEREEERESGHCPVCPGRVGVPTERERNALAEMRAIKERVRVLKSSLNSIRTDGAADKPGMVEKIEITLDSLREEWDRWEDERKAAAEERMVLLGHENME